MLKKIVMLSFMVLLLICVSCSADNKGEKEEQNIEFQVQEMKTKMNALINKIEKNPEAEEAGNWREQVQEYRQAIARLTGREIERPVKRDLPGGINLEVLHATVQELGLLLEQDPGNERAERRTKLYQYWNQLLAEYQADRPKKLSREQRIKQVEGAIQELKHAIENNPKAEKIGRWKEMLSKNEYTLQQLKSSAAELETEVDVGDMESLERRYGQIERKMKQTKARLNQLEGKEENREEIAELKEQVKQAELQLQEISSRAKKIRQALPPAYQRERGEMTAQVISATAEDVTVRFAESGRVMILRIHKTIRVEGRRVPNTEMIEFVQKLEKGELVWAKYHEGEEKGSFFVLEIKRVEK